jgi:hypothetical protein
MENNQVIGLAVTWSQLSNEVGTRAAINLASQPAVRQIFTAYRSRRPSSAQRALRTLEELNYYTHVMGRLENYDKFVEMKTV